MLTSLYSAVSGLQAYGNEISVIGNNIANNGTVGFKASRTSFEDIMSSSLGGGSTLQVGRGVLTGTIMPILTQSSFDTTQNATDLAIDGNGFFILKNKNDSGKYYFTRAGDFIFNKNGKLVNPNNFVVQGWQIDESTGEPTGDLTDIDISNISSSSKQTSNISLGINLDSTKDTKFVINKYNNKIVYNDGTSDKTITVEEGIYTGNTLAEKLTEKFGITDFEVTYDSSTGKFTFTNNTNAATGTDVTLKLTDANFTMDPILGFQVKDRDDADGDNNNDTGVDDLTIAKGGNSVKSDTYPNLTTKTVKITSENNIIKFSEDGGSTILTATIPPGTYTFDPYSDGTAAANKTSQLASIIETALNTASTDADLTYNVKYDDSTGKFEIDVTNSNATTAKTVKFYWGDTTVNNDPGVDTTAEQVLGFVKKTSDNENNPSVKNSFTLEIDPSSSSSLKSVYAPASIFDKTQYDYSSSINVYDSLGNAHTVTFYFKKVAENYWEWHATLSSDELDGGLPDDNGQAQPYEIGNGGHLSFNPSGSLREDTGVNDLVFNFSGGSKLLQNIKLDLGTPTINGGSGLDGITQFAASSTTFSQSQDGYPAGSLVGYSVSSDGVISGIYSNGEIKGLAKLAIAKFQNPWGLAQDGKNLFTQTVNSGDAIIGAAGSGGRGKVMSNALERSNVDIADQFVKLITAQRAYQANSRVITTTDQLLMEIVNLKR